MRLKHTYLNKAHSVGSQINQVKFRLQGIGYRLQVTGYRLQAGLALLDKFSLALQADFYQTLDHFVPVGTVARQYSKTFTFSLFPVTCPLSPHCLSPVTCNPLRSNHP